jgi:hypothetical protein
MIWTKGHIGSTSTKTKLKGFFKGKTERKLKGLQKSEKELWDTYGISVKILKMAWHGVLEHVHLWLGSFVHHL